MRLKVTFALLFVLLALLGYIVFFDPWSQADDPADATRSVLGPLAAQIDYLAIRNPDEGSLVELEKRDEAWFLVEPYLWPANAFAIERILEQLRFLESETAFDVAMLEQAEATLADYGLDPPDLVLVFGHRGARHELGIGRATDIGKRLYISSIDGRRVHVVDRSLLDSLSVDLDQLRDDRVFASSVFEVDSWNIQLRDVGNLRSRLSKINGRWLFETPFRARADAAAVESLLNQVLQLQAAAIVDPEPESLAPYGLQSPLLRLVVESHRGRESIEVGSLARPQVDNAPRYAKRASRPAVFETRIAFLDLLENAQTALRDRRILSIDAPAALSVSIREFDGRSLALQRLESGDWQILLRNQDQEMASRQGDPEAIAQLLSWLDNLKAVPEAGFPNDAPSAKDLERYGLQAPRLSVAVTSPRERDSEVALPSPATETLLLGDPHPDLPDESYLKLKERPFVYLVYNDFFDRIDSDPLRYQNRQLVDAPSPESVAALRIERLSDGATLLDTDRPEETEPPADPQDVAALRRAVHQLRASRFVADKYAPLVEIAGRETPWAYRIEIEIASEGSAAGRNGSRAFVLSEPTGGPVLLGGSIERDLIFRLPQPFIDAFSAFASQRPQPALPESPYGPAADADDDAEGNAPAEANGAPKEADAPENGDDAPPEKSGEQAEPSDAPAPPPS